jgi:hypothetical protein
MPVRWGWFSQRSSKYLKTGWLMSIGGLRWLLLKSSPAIAAGCIDGLYEYQGDLAGIQNCVHDSGRVLRLHLNAQQDTIVSAHVLESYNPLFEGITTGAIAGDEFYFVANTQLHKLTADGTVAASARFNPLHVLRQRLSNSRH